MILFNFFYITETLKNVFVIALLFIVCNFKLFFLVSIVMLAFVFLQKNTYSLSYINNKNSLYDVYYSDYNFNENFFPKINYFFKANLNYFLVFYFSIFIFVYYLVYYLIFFSNNVFSFFNQSVNVKINFLKNESLNTLFCLDYINIYFIILTNFVFIIVFYVFCVTKYKRDFLNYKLFFCMLFIIQFFIVLTFSVSNIFFFFFFFEASLIPVYLLLQIGGKGLKKKQYAGLSLIFFTLTGSIFLLFVIMYQFYLTNSMDFKQINLELMDFNSQLVLFFSFFIGFSVKIPIFPFYSWLPEAHVEAPTFISILLAAIFLKVASYGLLKIVVFNYYTAISYFYSFVVIFSLVSILITTFLTLIQTDLKKIVALSSIIHMNYMIIALFSLDVKAILGSFIYMFSHALVSSALFFLIGLLYENTGTRDLLNFDRMHNFKFYFLFFIFNLANIGFPLTISFVAEIIILNNLLIYNCFLVFFLVFFLFFSTVYTFWTIHNVFFGKIFFKKNFIVLNKFDIYFLIILFLIIFILGVLPSLIMFNLEQEIYLLLLNKLSNF